MLAGTMDLRLVICQVVALVNLPPTPTLQHWTGLSPLIFGQKHRDLGVPRCQQVADHQTAVTFYGPLRLLPQDRRVSLELEARNEGVRGPLLSQVPQHLRGGLKPQRQIPPSP